MAVQNWNKALKLSTAALVGKIPTVGFIAKALVNLFWPDNSPSLWDQIKGEVTSLVDSNILADDLAGYESTLLGLKNSLTEYNEAKVHEKGSFLSAMLVDLNNFSAVLMGEDYPGLEGESQIATKKNNKHPQQLIPVTLAAAHMHLSILYDRYHHGEAMYGEDNSEVWLKDLQRQYKVYTTFFNNIIPKWKAWRFSMIKGSWDKTATKPDPGSMSLPTGYAEGEAKDNLTGSRCRYEIVGDNEASDACKPAVLSAITRMQNQAVADFIGGISSVFYLNQYLPNANASEPAMLENLKAVKLGPYSAASLGIESSHVPVISKEDKAGRITSFNVYQDSTVKGIQAVFDSGKRSGEQHGLAEEQYSNSPFIGYENLGGFKMYVGRNGVESIAIYSSSDDLAAEFGYKEKSSSQLVDAMMEEDYYLVGLGSGSSTTSLEVLELMYLFKTEAV